MKMVKMLGQRGFGVNVCVFRAHPYDHTGGMSGAKVLTSKDSFELNRWADT